RRRRGRRRRGRRGLILRTNQRMRLGLSIPCVPIFGALLLAPASTFAQTTYTMTTGTHAFSSIATTGTLATLTDPDDGYATIAAGIAFPFFGTNVSASSSIYPSTNGLLAIFTPDASHTNASIPSTAVPNGFMAPLWDDLLVPSTGAIYWTVLTGSPRGLIIE